MTPPYESVPYRVIQYYFFLIDKTEKYSYTETIKGVADTGFRVCMVVSTVLQARPGHAAK